MSDTDVNTAVLRQLVDEVLGDLARQPTATVEEAGRVLGVGRSAIYAAVKAGTIPCVAIGRRRVVPVPALARLLLEGGITPSS
jgi:excisionase family DNA binding protein